MKPPFFATPPPTFWKDKKCPLFSNSFWMKRPLFYLRLSLFHLSFISVSFSLSLYIRDMNKIWYDLSCPIQRGIMQLLLFFVSLWFSLSVFISISLFFSGRALHKIWYGISWAIYCGIVSPSLSLFLSLSPCLSFYLSASFSVSHYIIPAWRAMNKRWYGMS